jgi:hypothetical protein
LDIAHLLILEGIAHQNLELTLLEDLVLECGGLALGAVDVLVYLDLVFAVLLVIVSLLRGSFAQLVAVGAGQGPRLLSESLLPAV